MHIVRYPLILAVFAACSSHTSDTVHTFRIYEGDGITIAETVGGPKYEGELFQYEQVLVLEEDPENEESLLFGPSHFFMSKDGYFFVADISERRIAVYNPEGSYSHSMGRKGSGPGEFQRLEIQSVRNGIISAWDLTLRRTTRFYTDGQLIDLTPIPSSITTDSQPTLFITPNGKRVVLSRETPFDGEYMEYERTGATVYSPRGESLWNRDFGWVKCRFIMADEYGMQTGAFYHYGPRPWCKYDPDLGIVYTSGAEPIVDIYALVGNHSRQIRLNLEQEYPSREDEERARNYLSDLVEQSAGGQAQDHWRSELENIRIPEPKAFWHRIEVDDTGYIWMLKPDHMFAFIDDAIDHFIWYVVSPEGEYLGQTKRFKNTSIRVSNGHLLAVEQDPESGEFQLIVYAINPATEGLKYP